MAQQATVLKIDVQLSDVDRGRYESLELRLARHPSESGRYLVARTLAYCLLFDDGIAFSKGGLSDTDEPPVAIRSLDGRLLCWIDVGAPSAERLHKASKAAGSVVVFTYQDPALLRKEAAQKGVHKGEQIEVWPLDPAFLDAVFAKIGKSTKIEVVRSGGELYVTLEGETFTTSLQASPLLP